MNLKLFAAASAVLCFLLLNYRCERATDNNQDDDGLPPAVPVGLSFYFAEDGEILIEWQNNSEADLKGYKVYKSTADSQYLYITFTTDNYFFDDSLYYDSTYFYKVSAVDIWDRESSLSPSINAKPINKFSPDEPRNFAVNARNWEGKESVFLSWEPNPESDVKGYNIYRNTASPFNADSANLMGFSDKETWEDTLNLRQLTPYYYKVRAVDKGGLLSGESAEVSDQILSIPEIIYPENDGIMIYYQNFKFTAAGAPASYKVVVQSNPILGTLWEKSISSGKTDDTLEVQFDYPYVESNKEYYWRVASFSGSSEPNSITEVHKFKIRP